MNFSLLNEHFKAALAEDLGDGDHSSLACIPATAEGRAHLLVKEDCVLAGISLAEHLFDLLGKNLRFEAKMSDGDFAKQGDIAFVVEGPSTQLLTLERLVLNYMQRLSGIATQANRYAQMVEGTKTKVLDTRKTTPGLRLLEKWAVSLGGCYNHRIGLYDMIMLKDNHIDFAGGIEAAIHKTKEYLLKTNKKLSIEVEVRNFEELETVLRVGGIQRIMLDNFNIEDTLKAVEIIDGRFEIESSGGITKETLYEYAKCGVDYISVGALTHQIKSVDLSLKAF